MEGPACAVLARGCAPVDEVGASPALASGVGEAANGIGEAAAGTDCGVALAGKRFAPVPPLSLLMRTVVS